MPISQWFIIAMLALVLGGCTMVQPRTVPSSLQDPVHEIDTSIGMAKGFDLQEASSLLELCIDLNREPDEPSSANTSAWEPVLSFESPHLGGRDKAHAPFDNAWKLWKRKGATQDYAVVIRGTLANARSILDDLLATSVASEVHVGLGPDRSLSFLLATTPGAEVHLGFAYGMAVLAFDQEQGILGALRALPPGSRIFITGHSQGAAIATLVHAFLHYAINEIDNRYDLQKQNFALKSYLFAQPKPGNWQFAMDFARIAGNRGTSYVINNSLDWVPQMPLTLEFLSEPLADMAPEMHKDDPNASRVVGLFSGMLKEGRALLSGTGEDAVDGMMMDYQASGHRLDERYFRSEAKPRRPAASSITYWTCGNLVPLFGSYAGSTPYAHDGWLSQHHALTYRELMKQQLK